MKNQVDPRMHLSPEESVDPGVSEKDGGLGEDPNANRSVSEKGDGGIGHDPNTANREVSEKDGGLGENPNG